MKVRLSYFPLSWLLVMLSITPALADTVIGGYELVETQRLSLYEYQYTYRAQITNTGAVGLNDVTATLSVSSANVVIIDGTLAFGHVAAGSTVTSTDTVVFNYDRSQPFGKISWEIQATEPPPPPPPPPEEPELEREEQMALSYSGSPTPNQTLVIGFLYQQEAANFTDIQWTLVKQPATSNLSLQVAADSKSVSLVPVVAGDYEIKVSANVAGERTETTTNFSVENVFPYDVSKVARDDPNASLDEIVGIITNQVWVYSGSLDEPTLRAVVTDNYPSLFTIMGYDAISGLLLQFDDTDANALEAIEELKLKSGIDNVYNRLHEGENAHVTEKLPDDVGQFNDGGGNWHLEKIGAPAAWDVTTGSDEFLIGVTDSGYYPTHEDLKGKFAEILINTKSAHGTAVVGAIAANTNNHQGISGINWEAQVIAGKAGFSGLITVLKKTKNGRSVLLANNSWAMGGHLPADFNPLNTVMATSRSETALKKTRTYRTALAGMFKNKLLVWAAGNGVGNGTSATEHYGVDAKFHSGAAHLDNHGSLSQLNNLILAAAIGNDNRLVYYSNYGQTVDIAAPTHYQSTGKVVCDDNGANCSHDYLEGEYGTNNKTAFSGTSAASSVVAGAASLIYAINPEFSPATVKRILIDTATEVATERYTKPNAGVDDVETLTHSIPILDLAEAVKYAREIQDLAISLAIPAPFVPEAQVNVTARHSTYQITHLDWKIESSASGSDNWALETEGVFEQAPTAIPLNLNANRLFYKVTATATLANTTTSEIINTTHESLFPVNLMVLEARDNVSLSPLANVAVSIEKSFADFSYVNAQGQTDSNGLANVWLEGNHSGTYKFRATHDGYQEAVKEASVLPFWGQESTAISLLMTPEGAAETGSLHGYVRNQQGNPISGAQVRISGGEQTNGYFASATTDVEGFYQISNINKKDSQGEPIATFYLSASKQGFLEEVKEGIIILAGKERTENFALLSGVVTTATLYASGFEADDPAWEATGLWHREALPGNTIVNTLVDDGFSLLPPDEDTEKAYLPTAFEGSGAWWYGKADTGSFIMEQYQFDLPLWGGTSVSPHEGALTSPEISLTSVTQPVVKFQTWWEIESVNPNSDGFDLLEVQISVDGGSFTTIKKLNPFVDPNDITREPKPFSSGGFNRKPVWVMEEIDLSEYIDKTVRIRFKFDTVDELFNGFRGWIIDDFAVIDTTTTSNGGTISVKRASRTGNDRFARFPADFVKVHKKPFVQ